MILISRTHPAGLGDVGDFRKNYGERDNVFRMALSICRKNTFPLIHITDISTEVRINSNNTRQHQLSVTCYTTTPCL